MTGQGRSRDFPSLYFEGFAFTLDFRLRERSQELHCFYPEQLERHRRHGVEQVSGEDQEFFRFVWFEMCMRQANAPNV